MINYIIVVLVIKDFKQKSIELSVAGIRLKRIYYNDIKRLVILVNFINYVYYCTL
jgi:hypothetical protein